MIAAQLLAYYFTELKDDQLKKVSESSFACIFFFFLTEELYNVTAAEWTPASCMSVLSLWGVSGWVEEEEDAAFGK